MPESLGALDAVVLDDYVYLVGGQGATDSNKVYAADITPPMDLYYREANASITLDKLSTELAGEFASSMQFQTSGISHCGGL